MISPALDAWTSSNNYAFLAIMVHYINKKGETRLVQQFIYTFVIQFMNTNLNLEELLIDFC